MLTMATDETRHYIQTIKRLKTQYTSWAASMRASDAYSGREGHTSNDAIGNALFMWAREQPIEELAKTLEPYVDRFQKLWIERDGGPAEPATESEATQRLPEVGHQAVSGKSSKKKGTG